MVLSIDHCLNYTQSHLLFFFWKTNSSKMSILATGLRLKISIHEIVDILEFMHESSWNPLFLTPQTLSISKLSSLGSLSRRDSSHDEQSSVSCLFLARLTDHNMITTNPITPTTMNTIISTNWATGSPRKTKKIWNYPKNSYNKRALVLEKLNKFRWIAKALLLSLKTATAKR